MLLLYIPGEFGSALQLCAGRLTVIRWVQTDAGNSAAKAMGRDEAPDTIESSANFILEKVCETALLSLDMTDGDDGRSIPLRRTVYPARSSFLAERSMTGSFKT